MVTETPTEAAAASLVGAASGRHLQRGEWAAVWSIVGLYLLLAISYSSLTPWGEAPDEAAHMRYVDYLVRNLQLPSLAGPHPYTYQAQHPPLYYVMGALLVWASRLPDLSQMRAPLNANVSPNPDALDPSKTGVYRVIKQDPLNPFPAYGLLLRALSIILSAATIPLVYLTARRIVPPPAPPLVAVVSALFAALLPQRLFVSMAVSNDNLAVLISAWLCLLLVMQLRGDRSTGDPLRGGRKAWLRSMPLWMGVALGAGLLAKYSVGIFAVPLLWALWVARRGDWRGFLRDAALMAAPCAVIAGPLFVYNTLSYGDPIASRLAATVVPGASSLRLSDLYWLRDPFRENLWTSFWGAFGWQRIYMSHVYYLAFGAATLLALLGGVRLIVGRALTRFQRDACAALLWPVPLAYAFVVVYSLTIVAWQGRLMYPAWPGLSVLFALGLCGLVMGRPAVSAPAGTSSQPAGAVRDAAVATCAVVLLFLLAANAYALVRIAGAFGAF